MATTHSCSFRLQPASGMKPAILRASRTGKNTSQSLPLSNSCRRVVGYKPTTDLHFVQEAMGGDPNAQEQLSKMYAAKLYRKAFSILRNKEDAQDALQDGWLRAYSNLRSFEGRSSFFTWLTQIVINSALMILRRNRNQREVSTDEAGETWFIHQIPDRSRNPEETLLESERKEILGDTIRSLRPRIRVMVELGPLQERSPKEAAQRLGISTPAAKGRLFHARAALRKSTVLRAVA